MKYAIIEVGGKQYRAIEGQELLLEKRDDKIGETITLTNVLLYRDDDFVLVGTPHVSEAKVTAKVLADVKGDKVRVSKFKAKVRYRKSIGFRPQFTKVSVEKIAVTGQKTKSSKA